MKQPIAWQTEVPIPSVEKVAAVLYFTKIVKDKVIPLYRLCNAKGETEYITCKMVDSYDIKTKTYKNYDHIPFWSIVDDLGVCNLEQLILDMIHNCKVLGIEVQEGIKEEGWAPYKEQEIVNRNPLGIDDPNIYFQKSVGFSDFDKNKDALIQEEVIDDIEPETVTAKREKAIIAPKINPVTVSSSVVWKEILQQMTIKGEKKGRGRPKKIYDDPILAAIPKTTPCVICKKEIAIVPMQIKEKAEKMGITVPDLIANYKCRSCGGRLPKGFGK